MALTGLAALQRAMSKAEARWATEEQAESPRPLTYEELPQLRQGDSITVVEHYINGRTAMFRARVTRVRQRGYTNLQGFWCAVNTVPGTAVEVLDALGFWGRLTEGEALVPSYRINYKIVPLGISRACDVVSNRDKIYRGWNVDP